MRRAACTPVACHAHTLARARPHTISGASASCPDDLRKFVEDRDTLGKTLAEYTGKGWNRRVLRLLSPGRSGCPQARPPELSSSTGASPATALRQHTLPAGLRALAGPAHPPSRDGGAGARGRLARKAEGHSRQRRSAGTGAGSALAPPQRRSAGTGAGLGRPGPRAALDHTVDRECSEAGGGAAQERGAKVGAAQYRRSAAPSKRPPSARRHLPGRASSEDAHPPRSGPGISGRSQKARPGPATAPATPAARPRHCPPPMHVQTRRSARSRRDRICRSRSGLRSRALLCTLRPGSCGTGSARGGNIPPAPRRAAASGVAPIQRTSLPSQAVAAGRATASAPPRAAAAGRMRDSRHRDRGGRRGAGPRHRSPVRQRGRPPPALDTPLARRPHKGREREAQACLARRHGTSSWRTPVKTPGRK
jgi:hypothetical protein